MCDRITYCDVMECCETCPRYGDDCEGVSAKPTVIQSKTLFPTKDFMEWAKRIKEVNPNAVVIPCDAEVASADAEPSLKAIKRQIDEHWYLDPPSAEAVSRTSKGICAVCERKQVCEDGNRNVDMIGCSRFERDTHYILSAETSQNLAKPNKELKGSDLISRDVVLSNIDERIKANGYGNVGLVSELNRLIGYVRNIPSADAVQGWIPCSERLPKDLDPVNATWVNHNPPCYYMDIMNVPFTGTCVRYKGKWYWWDSTICDALGEYGEECGAEPIDKHIEITAWMPLPKPYKGGDDE